MSNNRVNSRSVGGLYTHVGKIQSVEDQLNGRLVSTYSLGLVLVDSDGTVVLGVKCVSVHWLLFTNNNVRLFKTPTNNVSSSIDYG